VAEISAQIWGGDDYVARMFDQWAAEPAGYFAVVTADTVRSESQSAATVLGGKAPPAHDLPSGNSFPSAHQLERDRLPFVCSDIKKIIRLFLDTPSPIGK
jgi:hypothetical protein